MKVVVGGTNYGLFPLELIRSGGIGVGDFYAVGYDDRKYFSKEFKKQYGKTPTDYVAAAESN